VYVLPVGCPDDQTLLAMLEHSVDPTRFGELEVHIDGCQHCRKAVAALALGSRSPSTPAKPFAGIDLDLAIGATIHDRYVVASEIGRGGMGTVYVAHDKTLGRDVALKLHRAGSGSDRLHREAIAMAKLAHPNVVNVFEVASVDDRMYVAMEYVRGGTLRGWLAATPRSWRECIAMLVEAGRGLAAAHAAGLVHRDFKPENVLVGEDGRPRVGDFGLARTDHTAIAADPDVLATAMTVTGGLAGTPAYMAPEQLAGSAVDARSDQFAFAVVAWECLFGKRPFAGATLATLAIAIERHELVRSNRDVPDRVCRVIERALETSPDARYADMPALIAALQRAAAPRTTRNVIATVAAAAVIGAGAFLTYSAVMRHQREVACTRAAEDVRALFAATARTAMQHGFLATGATYAPSAFAHASSVLDRYTGALADQAATVCRDRDQPERVIAAREACLAAHTTELSSLVGELAHADLAMVQRAPDAAWAVFDPSPCTDAAPSSSAPLAAADATKLGDLKALSRTGRFKDGLALATPFLADARARKDKSLELDILMTLGQIQAEIDPPAAVATYHDADAIAEARGNDLDAAVALVALANSSGTDTHDYVTAHRQLDLARAKLARIGGNSAIEGQLSMTEAQILVWENRLGEAETAMRASVATLEKIYGPEHPSVGSAYGELTEVLRAESKNDEALAAGRKTLAILTPALGEAHPTVAGAKMNLASVLAQTHHNDEARRLLGEADKIFVAAYGSDHAMRAAIYGNLGTVELVDEHYDAALTAFLTARGIIERTAGPDAAEIAGVEHDVMEALGGLNRLDEALVAAQRAVAVLEKLGPAGQNRLAVALVDVCEVQIARDKAADCIPVAERALALAEKRPADANPGDLAEAQFMLARLLWEAHRDDQKARTLAQAAEQGPNADQNAKIHAWLETHAK